MNRLLGIGAVAAVVVGFLSFKKGKMDFKLAADELVGNCAMCGLVGNFVVEDLPVGPRWFCTEKHFAEYAGLPVKEFGYYGFEAEESKKLVQCKGHLPSCKKMIDPNRTWWIDEKGEGWPALDEYGEEGYCDDCIGYSIDSHSRALGQGHDAESFEAEKGYRNYGGERWDKITRILVRDEVDVVQNGMNRTQALKTIPPNSEVKKVVES